MILGILAHVDAGKTTLSERLLYETGQIKSAGSVDRKDTVLDTDIQERERGITIFSKQARIRDGEFAITLLDTPGHVDFSAEMERTLQVLDYAILVVSGTDGVQGHTRTLWRLLAHYQVPAVLFVNKMDLVEGALTDETQKEAVREALRQELKRELSDGCVDFSDLALSHQSGTLEGGTDRRGTPEVVADRSGRSSEAGGSSGSGATSRRHEDILEQIAMCRESLLDEYMESGTLAAASIAEAVRERELFPCVFGSARTGAGVRELIETIRSFLPAPAYPSEFAARVYKIGRDPQGARLTYLKLTGGTLRVKDVIAGAPKSEGDTDGEEPVGKVDQIRLYSGEKYETTDHVEAGEVCAVTGLSATRPGQGLGAERAASVPILEPVMTYRIDLPDGVSPMAMMEHLRTLEEEDPQLHVVWDDRLKEIHLQMMGLVQTQILTRVIKDRFGVVVTFGPGSIVYKETIAKPVEGVGHFEPLRHYAEVHLLLEPGEPGSGIQVASVCSEDVLALNWQRLIATHVGERTHRGVLCGGALTDVKVTILTGRAHLKHTEGGDFRQATYRAIRQGLKSTESVLLEPYYQFLLEIPTDHVGRAMTDLTQRCARFEAPVYLDGDKSGQAQIAGRAPASTMQDYRAEVEAYTKGLGFLSLELSGYDVCHNSAEVIAEKGYDSEADLAQPTGSVFCAHGAGFVVPWDEVAEHMHLPYIWHGQTGEELREAAEAARDGFSYDYEGASYQAADLPGAGARPQSWEKSVAGMSEMELSAKLQDVYAREFGQSEEELAEVRRRKRRDEDRREKPKAHVKLDKKGNPIYPAKRQQEEYLIVDGYNIIFAWDELKELARENIDAARDRLKDILLNYQGWRGCRLLLVFDAYRVKGNPGREEFYNGLSRRHAGAVAHAWDRNAADGGATKTKAGKKTNGTDRPGIRVVYTRENETADAYIERTVHEIGGKYRVTVATSDGLEQLTVLSMGALRMSARQLREEVERAPG